MNPIPNLKVSGKAHELALRIFEQTRARAWSHDHALRARLQERALSVALYIARGAQRDQRDDFVSALTSALSLLREVAYCLVFARDLGLLTTSSYATLEARAGELERMLVGLRHRVRSSGSGARPPRGFRSRSSPTRLREALKVDGAAQPAAPHVGAPLSAG
ncbi:MAG: four helix bundle protein [Gemmatimonadota bacterium]